MLNIPVSRRVLIGTPAHTGQVDVFYANSLTNSIRYCLPRGIDLREVYLSFDSIVQNARNDLVKIALEGIKAKNGRWMPDDLIFIDADQDWRPEWIERLLNYPVDVVGGAVRKKTDQQELYNVKHSSLDIPVDPATGLMVVDALGSGFIRMSRHALQVLWDNSEPYHVWGKEESRWIYDLRPINGELVGEDTMVSMKLREHGIPTYLDPGITCGHIGPKRFAGDFAVWLKGMQDAVIKDAA